MCCVCSGVVCCFGVVCVLLYVLWFVVDESVYVLCVFAILFVAWVVLVCVVVSWFGSVVV